MSNLATANTAANEIVKAVDFDFAHDQAIKNAALSIQAILTDSEKDFVIGGRVKPYPSGGLNFIISPIFGHCVGSGITFIETLASQQPISIETADPAHDRIDTIQVRGKEELYDTQDRKFRDPASGAETVESIATKKRVRMEVSVKKGYPGSATAPSADTGFIKLAEIAVPAAAVGINASNIKNISAKTADAENEDWTTEKTRSFNPGYITDIINNPVANILVKAANILLGNGSDALRGLIIPTGRALNIMGTDFNDLAGITHVLIALANAANAVNPYVNYLLSRYQLLESNPVAASTENVDVLVGGEITVDGIPCTQGQMVLLKNQNNPIENGLWEVQPWAWRRYTGFTAANPGCFNQKLILVKSGAVNGGRVYYLPQDTEVGKALYFQESIFSTQDLPGKVVIRDETGKSNEDKKRRDDIQTILDAIAAATPGEPIQLDLRGLLPPGGTTGQIVAKKSDDDYDTEWIDPPVGVINNGNSVTNIVNGPSYNPGTRIGGIFWTDPTIDFEYIEIFEISGANPVSVAQIAPGVQYFEPAAGSHRYLLRVRLASGEYAGEGVELPQTNYQIVYTANLLSVTIPMAAANQIVLSFDNFIKITNANGFSISGINDTLQFLDQPDNKTIRLQLTAKLFSQGGNYSLNYNPATGNVLQNNNAPISAITGQIIENYADYVPAEFVSAQIPQAEPSALVLVMSRPIHITDVGAFTLTGTTAQIQSLISEGVTVEIRLDEPVDSVASEPNIKLTYNGTGVTDDMGQPVDAFSNRAVTNNSTNVAISIQSAEVPANNSQRLIVVMEGAVKMTNADGFALSSIDQNDLPDLSAMAYNISDGTITFTLDRSLLTGKSFVVAYSGNGTLRKNSNNDKIKAFSQAVTNNSTDVGGIPASPSERNLSIVVLGREPTTPAEVTQVCTMIHQTIAGGQVANLVNGDYFYPIISATYPFVVAAGDNGYGAINLTANADLGVNGKHIGFRIVSKNGHKGKNGNNYDHVIIHMMNTPGYATSDATATGYWMEQTNINTNGYQGCRGRQYLLNNFLPALKAIGIPFDENWMAAPARKVSKGGSASNPGFDLIEDKIILPTEYEIQGTHTYSNSQAEAAGDQGRWEYYDSNAKRIKYNKANATTWYWCASPCSGTTTYFCAVDSGGSAGNGNASHNNGGVAPAFCVA